MGLVTLTIDSTKAIVEEGVTILEAARSVGIYISAICAHPDLPPFKGIKSGKVIYRDREVIENESTDKEFEGCGLCVVEIEGLKDFSLSCITPVSQGMVVHTNTPKVQQLRRDSLTKLLETHPHNCLICAQREGCSLSKCSSNVPENERCCPKFNYCELRKVAEYAGLQEDMRRYIFRGLPILTGDPLYKTDYNLCIGCLRCVRICRDIRGIDALDFIFQNGKVTVGRRGPSLKEAGCKFCGACVEVCPTGALMDKDLMRAEGERALIPCKFSCPAEIDVPRYVHYISEGKFAEAAAIVREKVPFPLILGHICPHPCEVKCRRGQVNEPIAIKVLKRCAMEQDGSLWKDNIKIAPKTGKKVGIIGSGPAGLTVAYHLTRFGHSVTVYEASAKPGGMMRLAIPRFILPENILDKEINEILSLGVALRLNTMVESVDELFKEGYEAIFIATGLPHGRKLPIPGAEAKGVLIGLSFLNEVNKGEEVRIGKKVLVLGGGGVACDVARVALRLGAREVSMACLESEETLPALPEDISQAKEEGIKLFPSHAFSGILEDNGVACGVDCLSVKWMKFDEEGKLNLETISGSEHILEADTVIFTVGQGIDRFFFSKSGIDLTTRGTIKTSRDTLKTNREGVFAGGDATAGPASVIEAIALGRRAAEAIDKYLQGSGTVDEFFYEKEKPTTYLGREEGFGDKSRVEVPCLPPEQRIYNFDKVEHSFNKEEAIREAKRCLKCNLRFQISSPPLPPEKWLKFEEAQISPVPEVEGVFQLLDENKNILLIKGTQHLRVELESQLTTNQKARYFIYEKAAMYTSRESELLQQFLQQHGKLPPQNALDFEDLF